MRESFHYHFREHRLRFSAATGLFGWLLGSLLNSRVVGIEESLHTLSSMMINVLQTSAMSQTSSQGQCPSMPKMTALKNRIESLPSSYLKQLLSSDASLAYAALYTSSLEAGLFGFILSSTAAYGLSTIISNLRNTIRLCQSEDYPQDEDGYFIMTSQAKLLLKAERFMIALGGVLGAIKYMNSSIPDSRLLLLTLLFSGAGSLCLVKSAFFFFLEACHSTARENRVEAQRLCAENRQLFEQVGRDMARERQALSLIEPTDDTPGEFICLITRFILNDPVLLPDGRYYERSAIQDWYDRGGRRCPLNANLQFPDPSTLDTDRDFQQAIQHYVDNMNAVPNLSR